MITNNEDGKDLLRGPLGAETGPTSSSESTSVRDRRALHFHGASRVISVTYTNINVTHQLSVEREYDLVYGGGLVPNCQPQAAPGSHADVYREIFKTLPANLVSQQPRLPPGPAPTSELNQFGYRSYKRERPDEKWDPPCVSISHLSYSVDLRKSWERLMLRMSRRHFLIRDVSFDLSGGDIMALMSGSEAELRALLDALSGRGRNGRIKGDFSINDNRLRPEQFAARTAYVTTEELSTSLTVVQYLRISVALHPPATKAFKNENMIEQLIGTLALAHRRHALCSRLSNSEAQRLRIAAQLLKDTDIFICGDVTRSMDSYETAFLVDYLRDWAIKLNRVVLMAIAPSSFEILLMFSKCQGLPGALLTSGRFVYFDTPTKMKSYFESIGFSCPPYKNPCDFYVDVATHDHLSQAASLESSSRISKLIQFWEQNKPPPRCFANSPLSPSLCRPPVLRTVQALYMQRLFEFANEPLESLREPLIALLISLAIGLAYSSLTREKRVGADDRIGFATALLYFGMIPWIYIVIQKVVREKKFVREVLKKTQLSSLLFLIHKISCDIPIIILTSALYSIPLPFLIDTGQKTAFGTSREGEKYRENGMVSEKGNQQLPLCSEHKMTGQPSWGMVQMSMLCISIS
ncbi:hypothetical protein ANCCAN_08976 [Ancylostoma caninum]|uniref:ABC transporter domain-containing protein n=1 Tax=Ancylostoma caninum TaxID=29170 RepID=A0A368GKZ5_ANCCA|nr:hypothetical protein ANCCAN_08976 [Ancylostoma caninum]